MKTIIRVLVWTLVFIILCPLSMAKESISKDEFTIHNGTKFGMSSESVRTTEAEKGVVLTDLDSRWSEEGVTSFFTRPRISLAGRNEGEVTYVFKNDELVYVSYWFNTDGMSSDAIAQDYSELMEAFMKKYGSPDFDIDSGTASKLPKEKYCHTAQVLQLSEKSENYKPIDYRQWQIDCEDGSGILVELYLYKYNSKSHPFVSEGVHYTWYDSSEYSSLQKAEEDRQKQMNDDI